MRAENFAERIRDLGIKTLIGVPDSTLKQFCDYINTDGEKVFDHYVPVNEGAAVGLAAGIYLGTGNPSCVYMQNSGIGNAVNPIASLMNDKVYKIPALYLVGWRGEPGFHDEPQHIYQGEITEPLLKLLGLKTAIIDNKTTDSELTDLFSLIADTLADERQFALIIRKDTFDQRPAHEYKNDYEILREDAIKAVIKSLKPEDVVISTTGKISREVYEQFDEIKGSHKQAFLTVGSMGHASMIALGYAKSCPNKRVYCIDGDGAALMHMGSMRFMAKQNPTNLVHIILNNDAHESVGGMPTGAANTDFASLAKTCGYEQTYSISNLSQLISTLQKVHNEPLLTMIEVKVKMDSRSDLGRPKESAEQNKKAFITNG